MTRSAMNPGFFRADGFHEFDTVLHAKLQNLLLDTPKYAVMLADESKRKRDPSAGDRVRVALVDLTGDKLCKPGYADWGSTFPITGGSTVKIAMLYAAHQLLFDLNEMARTGGLKTAAELKKKADEVWSQLICPPDLDWLVEFDSKGPTVRAKASKNLDVHLNQMVNRAFSGISVGRANQLIMRLGFEYIASVLWQSGLRRSRGRGLWVRNTYAQKKILATMDPNCHYKMREERPWNASSVVSGPDGRYRVQSDGALGGHVLHAAGATPARQRGCLRQDGSLAQARLPLPPQAISS